MITSGSAITSDIIGLATSSDSIIIILLVVVVLLAVVSTPLFKMWATTAEKKRQNDYDREGRFIQVIKDNGEKSEKVAEAITKLATVLTINDQHCESCKAEQLDIWNTMYKEVADIRTTFLLKVDAVTTIASHSNTLVREVLDLMKANPNTYVDRRSHE